MVLYTQYILIILIVSIIGELMAFVIMKLVIFINRENNKRMQKTRTIFFISTMLGITNFIVIMHFLPLFYRYASAIMGKNGAVLIFTIAGFILGFIHYFIAKHIYSFYKR